MKVREFACLVGVLLALGWRATRADGPIANLNPDRSDHPIQLSEQPRILLGPE
jgi:hypothetical protein